MGFGKPKWLEALFEEIYFVTCSIHETSKKNEKNICCLDCCNSICPHCVISHRYHRLLQIRRYVYHDVVRTEDIEKLIDCSNVQAYTINNAKVIFIKKRPQNRQLKGCGNFCTSCDRCLQEPFIHCSLECKVDFVVEHYRDISPFLRTCKTLQLGHDFFIPQHYGDDIDMTNETPNSTVVDSMSTNSSASCGSTENMSLPWVKIDTLYFYKKKRSGNLEDDFSTGMSRRKGVPRRSPLS